eukprot:CAMPEP_0115087392 /NCGR_PEP_ID=MMETSP0227-20121206/23244_1 /TAXON_ID=89957 /ORGANISM="Polarella glacialis, Strain CCMP 1383" /LENGTH=136 /DNA_ID=CAMNT_0002477213 /DNA_START=43 /DNA_END=450 /DNA_ORIENTATION=+
MGATASSAMGATASSETPRQEMPCQDDFNAYLRCCKENDDTPGMVDCETIMYKFRQCMEKKMEVAGGYTGVEQQAALEQRRQEALTQKGPPRAWLLSGGECMGRQHHHWQFTALVYTANPIFALPLFRQECVSRDG